MSKRTPEQYAADRVIARRRERAFYKLYENAMKMPGYSPLTHEQEAAMLRERILKWGHTPVPRISSIIRILKEYDERPHVHSLFTDHSLGIPCRLGKRHPGCCPRTPGCDAPGKAMR